ncbi:MAG: hypothetical protein M3N14_12620 [Bacteroidota bacterium]|nr:hypothetical protein [Bacteroidota bacterium]
MCWYKTKAGILSVFISGMILLSGCRPDIKETGATLTYFDLKGFFTTETALLIRAHKVVLKTVTHNGVTETKKVRIDDWGREFDLFIGSDINRPAWKNSYNITLSGDFLIYRAKYPELKMHQMLIKKDNGKVRWILIFNRTKNLLYQTDEKLSYFPDSLYTIEKDQRVRLMGSNTYKIQGMIGK